VPIRVDVQRYHDSPTFEAYLESVVKNAELWRAVYRTSTVDPASVSRLGAVADGGRFLALSEDWCTDAVSVLPVIARLAEQAGVDLRVLARDANPDLMDAHLTCGTRSIPVVMVLDRGGAVRAWWGPRPCHLQRWMRTEGIWLPNEDRARRKRAWYARDRGRSSVAEVVEMAHRAARRSAEST
jgi:hypothetical protein